MESYYFFIAQAGFVALTAICLLLILYATRHTLLRMGWERAKATKRTVLVGAVLLGWILFASVLALRGVLADFSSLPPRLLLVILPPLIAAVWLTFNPGFKAFLGHVPASWLLYMQVFRVPVEILLWLLFVAGHVPVQMTFEGQNWDVITGITAPIAAWICSGQGRNSRAAAIAWNIFGLALLINIVTVAILSTPSPFRAFLNEPANTVVAQFPIVFLPALLVPLAYTLHFFSLRKLYLERENTDAILQLTPVANAKSNAIQ
jgi:hypothetical protein